MKNYDDLSIEFICGNKETGIVWWEFAKDFVELLIGSEIELTSNDGKQTS